MKKINLNRAIYGKGFAKAFLEMLSALPSTGKAFVYPLMTEDGNAVVAIRFKNGAVVSLFELTGEVVKKSPFYGARNMSEACYFCHLIDGMTAGRYHANSETAKQARDYFAIKRHDNKLAHEYNQKLKDSLSFHLSEMDKELEKREMRVSIATVARDNCRAYRESLAGDFRMADNARQETIATANDDFGDDSFMD